MLRSRSPLSRSSSAFGRRILPEPEPVSPFQHLDERKAAIYENLRDLQFEYRVGKLSDADYQSTKKDLQKELAARAGRSGQDEELRLPARRQRRHSRASQTAAHTANGLRLPVLRRQVREGPEVLRRMRQAHEGGDSVMRTISRVASAIVADCCFCRLRLRRRHRHRHQPDHRQAASRRHRRAQQARARTASSSIDQAKSDAQGKFTINQEHPRPRALPDPHGLRWRHLQPHAAARVAHHRPDASTSTTPPSSRATPKSPSTCCCSSRPAARWMVNETYLFKNDGKTAWNDPR